MPTVLPTSAYRELSRWFPTVTDRARALGRSRETLTTWERELLDYSVKPSTAHMINSVASVTQDVEELIGDARGAGRWMLTPQPQLRGKTPIEMISLGQLDQLSAVIYPSEQVTPKRTVQRPSRAPTGVVSFPRRRERERTAEEAAVLRRVGEDEELIGPVKPPDDRRRPPF